MIVDITYLENYLGVNSKNRHKYYDDSVKLAESLKVHADGLYSEKLIGERRPSESDEIKKYRETIFEPITKAVFSKIYATLQKIRRSPDFVIMFTEKDETIRDGEDLEDYITELFPYNTSVVNWFFNVCFKYYLTDANAVLLVMPMDISVPENEYYKPYPYIFTSENIIDYKRDKYYVLKSKETHTYTEGKRTYNDGFIYYIATDTHVHKYVQINTKGRYIEEWVYEHNIGTPPVVTMEGLLCDQTENYILNESRLSPIVPHLNEALREYSDLQAEVVQHVHTTMWAHQGQECGVCKGIGSVILPGETIPVKCDRCKGEGFYPFNPYSNITIPTPRPGQTAIAPPFAGHIEKNLGIAELQDKRVRQHTMDALSSINFEHLAETLINQSGVAKQYDNEGANNTIHSIAEDIVRILDDVIYFINEERYMTSMPDTEERQEGLPTITVPEKYDLVSEHYLVEGIGMATEKKVAPAIIVAMQIDYVQKKYSTDIPTKDNLVLQLSLDPFAGIDEDTILSQVSMGWASKEDATIHANISKYIDMAIEANKEFVDLPAEEQRAYLLTLAQQEIGTNAV